MATYDLTPTGSPAQAYDPAPRTFVRSYELDFAVQNIGVAESAAVIDIPANTLVQNVVVQVLTQEGAAETCDVGDGASATAFLSNVDLNTLGNTISSTGRLYTAAGQIVVTADTALAVGKIKVTAVMANVADGIQ